MGNSVGVLSHSLPPPLGAEGKQMYYDLQMRRAQLQVRWRPRCRVAWPHTDTFPAKPATQIIWTRFMEFVEPDTCTLVRAGPGGGVAAAAALTQHRPPSQGPDEFFALMNSGGFGDAASQKRRQRLFGPALFRLVRWPAASAAARV